MEIVTPIKQQKKTSLSVLSRKTTLKLVLSLLSFKSFRTKSEEKNVSKDDTVINTVKIILPHF